MKSSTPTKQNLPVEYSKHMCAEVACYLRDPDRQRNEHSVITDERALCHVADLLDRLARGERLELKTIKSKESASDRYVRKTLEAIYDKENPAKTLTEAYERAAGVNGVKKAQEAFSKWQTQRGARIVLPHKFRK